METKLFVATKVFIEYQGKILVIRESSSYRDGTKRGLYDLVGGRIAPGEHWDTATTREIVEETNLSIELGSPFFINESWPLVKEEQWQIIRIFLSAKALGGKVELGEDHDDYQWIEARQYRDSMYPVIENLYPAFEEYVRRFSRT